MNKQMIKDALILFVITLVAGLLLSSVYAITKDPIAETKEAKKQEAFRNVFAGAASFQDLDEFDPASAQSFLLDNGYEKQIIDEVKVAVDASGAKLGYVITITSKEAYGGSLQIAMGIRLDGTLNEISFLSLEETTGLGMEAKKPTFYEQFSEKQVEAFIYTKSGAFSENEIDALSGATITTNAVTNAVNAGLLYARYLGLSETGNASGDGGDAGRILHMFLSQKDFGNHLKGFSGIWKLQIPGIGGGFIELCSGTN